MSKKFKATEQQIANDPSLRWAHYRWGEAIWSDEHSDMVRFTGWDGEDVLVATLGGIAPLGKVHWSKVRRTSGPGHVPGQRIAEARKG